MSEQVNFLFPKNLSNYSEVHSNYHLRQLLMAEKGDYNKRPLYHIKQHINKKFEA